MKCIMKQNYFLLIPIYLLSCIDATSQNIIHTENWQWAQKATTEGHILPFEIMNDENGNQWIAGTLDSASHFFGAADVNYYS